MPVLLLPDLFAISFLTVVLALIHRKFRHEAGTLWTTGLLLIVVECVAHLCFAMTLPLPWHRLSHVIALIAYLFAGFVFLQSANPTLRTLPHSALYRVCTVFPLALLLTLYGADIRSRLAFCLIAGFGFITGIGATLLLHRGRRNLLFLCLLWLPVVAFAFTSSFRAAAYSSLAMLYALLAVCFLQHLPSRSGGRLLIAAGFFAWALCFATHPWVEAWGSTYVRFAAQVWDMQKFLITIGFVLQMFEREVWHNEWLALHDQLTGLPNRRLYEERLAEAIARADRDGTSVILFTMDLDGFKKVNDTLGHEAGDIVLRQIGFFLQRVVRKTDTLARMGGDEFTLLAVDVAVPGTRTRDASQTDEGTRRIRKQGNTVRGSGWTGRHAFPFRGPLRKQAPQAQAGAAAGPSLQLQADRIASDLRVAVEQPVNLPLLEGDRVLHLFTSIGFAIYPEDTRNIAELSRLADRRMYDDKLRRAQTGDPFAVEAATVHSTGNNPAANDLPVNDSPEDELTFQPV